MKSMKFGGWIIFSNEKGAFDKDKVGKWIFSLIRSLFQKFALKQFYLELLNMQNIVIKKKGLLVFIFIATT